MPPFGAGPLRLEFRRSGHDAARRQIFCQACPEMLNPWYVAGGFIGAVFGGAIVLELFLCTLRGWMRVDPWRLNRIRRGACRLCFELRFALRCAAKCLRCRGPYEARFDGPGVPRAVPGALTGIIERAVFVSLAAVAPLDQAALAMGGWIGLKLAANWHRALPRPDGEPPTRAQTLKRNRLGFLALLADLLSMAIAALGGVVVSLGLGVARLPWLHP